MRKPLFGPAPFVAIGTEAEVDAAAVAMPLFSGDAVGDAAAFAAMTIVGAHIRHIIFTKLVHKTHRIRVAAKDPGELAGSKEGKGIGGRGAGETTGGGKGAGEAARGGEAAGAGKTAGNESGCCK